MVITKELLNKDYCKTVLVIDREYDYFPYTVYKDKKDKDFWNNKDIIKDPFKLLNTDKVKELLEALYIILLKNDNGFVLYMPDKDKYISEDNLLLLITKINKKHGK